MDNKQWQELFNLIPNTLQATHSVVPDQILGKTWALVKVNPDYPKHINQGHQQISAFYPKKELKAFLMGMQEQIRIQQQFKNGKENVF